MPHILLLAIVGLVVGYKQYGLEVWEAFKYSIDQGGIYFVAAVALTFIWFANVPALYVIIGILYFYLIVVTIAEAQLA